jgi:DNA repair exonuclease SbcCD ATPase subunit
MPTPGGRDLSEWHRRRAQAATRALADAEGAEENLRRAEAALHAADRAVGGVVPLEEYEQLALDYGAWKVRAEQAEELLERTLEALDRIAGSDEAVATQVRDLAFATGTEVRALLGAQREPEDDEPA